MSDAGSRNSNAHTFLCFDYGTTKIGVAVGQSITRTASALTELPTRDGIPNWRVVETLLNEWQPDLLLVGLPLNMDSSESELSIRARKFGNRLHGRFGLPVQMVDERLSSFEARGKIIQDKGSRDFKRHGVDSLAAKLILETWFGGI